MSEVPLYWLLSRGLFLSRHAGFDLSYGSANFGAGMSQGSPRWLDQVEGYIAHKKTPNSLGPP